ncbi:hypothetical protein LTR28_008129 [Elasticomyces elasticus]|nr:hypothetical protein LTR28_008129 [Elasticomyces elasticus]
MAHPDPGEYGSSGSNDDACLGYQDSCDSCRFSYCVFHDFADYTEIPPRSPLTHDGADDLLSEIDQSGTPAPTHVDDEPEEQPDPSDAPQHQQSNSGHVAALTSDAVRQLQEDPASIGPLALQDYVYGQYQPLDHEFPSKMQDDEPVARQGEQPQPHGYQNVSSSTSRRPVYGSDSHPACSDKTYWDPMEGPSTTSACRPVLQQTSQQGSRHDAEDATDTLYPCQHCDKPFETHRGRQYVFPNPARMSKTHSR